MSREKNLSIQQWLKLAGLDLRSAKNDLKDNPPVTNTACYHAQQCAEKSLKAFIVRWDQHIEKTHDLTLLLKTCIKYDLEFEMHKTAAQRLTDYAITTRYPDFWREIPVAEAREAVEIAGKVFKFVSVKLKAYLDASE